MDRRPPRDDECQCWGRKDGSTGLFVIVYVCDLCKGTSSDSEEE